MASWWRSRAVVLGTALLALIAVVALAARAHAPAGGGGTRHVNGDLLFEYGALVVLLIMAVGFPLAVWSMWRARDEGDPLPRRGNWMLQLLLTTALVAAVIVAYMIYRSHRQNDNGTAAQPTGITRPDDGAAGQRQHTARFDWVPLIVVLGVGLGGAGIALVLLTRAGRVRPRPDQRLAAAALSDALDESLDDLRAERDPRRAVIAAYARMERALAVAGVPRRPSEAPLEYLARVLSDFLHASAASVTRLTALFERARFSHHEIGPQLKEEAIDALVAIRAELRTLSA
jgi:Domain of unknown function (DUF4129)